MTLLQLTKVDPRPLTTPTADEIEKFRRDPRLAPGPDLASLRLDLESTNWESSVWNLAAADMIADQFVQDEEYQCKNKRMVREAFKKHLRQLRDRYRRQEWQRTNDKEAEVNEARSLRNLRRSNRRRSVSLFCDCVVYFTRLINNSCESAASKGLGSTNVSPRRPTNTRS